MYRTFHVSGCMTVNRPTEPQGGAQGWRRVKLAATLPTIRRQREKVVSAALGEVTHERLPSSAVVAGLTELAWVGKVEKVEASPHRVLLAKKFIKPKQVSFKIKLTFLRPEKGQILFTKDPNIFREPAKLTYRLNF